MTDGPPSSRRRRGTCRARALAGCLSALLLAGLLPTPAPAQERRRGLTGSTELARAYGAILDSRFDDLPQLLAEACGPAPREACQLLDVVGLWWQIHLDPLNRTRDALFQTRADAAIASAEAWTRREPQRAEAWFYLGGAYGARVQWRALRGLQLAAARDGKRIKEALERALVLDPALADAHFGVGLYRYYAAVAPTAVKVLRWLLLLPGGDRSGGMADIDRARSSGLLLRGEADYQLHLIYLWYEKRPESALDLLTTLVERHPRNPRFREAIAEIHDTYRHDAAASLRAWEALLTDARAGRVAHRQLAETTAALGLARQLDRVARGEDALELLRAVIAARPAAPFGAVPRAHLQLGEALDHLGRTREAGSAYRDAIAAAGRDDPLRIVVRARALLRAHR